MWERNPDTDGLRTRQKEGWDGGRGKRKTSV